MEYTAYIFFGVLFIISVLELSIYFYFKRKYLSKKCSVIMNLFKVAHIPIQLCIWIIGASFVFSQKCSSLDIPILDLTVDLCSLRSKFIYFAIFFVIIRFLHKYERDLISLGKRYYKRCGISDSYVSYLQKIFSIIYWIVSIAFGLFLLTILGLEEVGKFITTMLGASVFTTVAVSFIAKDLLSEWFGGMRLKHSKPFQVGNWIKSVDGSIEGTVESIGWHATTVRTFEKVLLIIPNSMLAGMSIENKSLMQNRRIKTVIGIRYEDANKMATIVKDIATMLKEHPEIDTSKTCFVHFIEFGPSSLNFLIYCYTKTTDWIKYQSVQQDIFLDVLNIIDNHEAACAFPTTVVHLDKS